MSDFERLKAVVSAAGDAGVILDADDMIVWWSDRARILLGWPPVDMIGARLEKVIAAPYPQTREDVALDAPEDDVDLDVPEQAAARPPSTPVVQNAKRRDGEIVRVEMSRAPWPPWTLVFIREAAREALIRQLNECEDRFHAAVEAVDGVLWTNSPDGQMVGDQPGWRDLTGQTESEYRGLGWANAVHPADAAASVRAWLAAVAEKKPFVFEHRVRRRDGIWRDFAVRAIPVQGPDGALREWVGIHTDVTEQRAAHARLQESEARFRAIADAAPSPVWVTSADGGVQFVNTAFATFAGRQRDGLLGNVWLDLLHPSDIPVVLARRAEARVVPTSYSFEARFRTATGAYRWMLANARPRFDEQGRFDGYVGMAMDLSEIKASQQHQRLLINELNHRVKNTLATIQSIARQTLRPDEVAPEIRERLIDRLMAMSSAHDILTRQSWSGATLADIVEQALKPFIDEDIVKRLRVEGPPAYVNPAVALGLSMALHELATNALKYGALSVDFGHVEIRWDFFTDERVTLTWCESGGPLVAPPTRRGFGLRLLERNLAADLGGKAELLFASTGLQARFAFTASKIDLVPRP